MKCKLMLWFMDYESYKQWENRFQAREVDGIDLILGGHDHHYTHSVESDVTILKSGSEFREFSTIDVKYYGRHSVSIFRCHLHLYVTLSKIGTNSAAVSPTSLQSTIYIDIF